jgi:quinoprotein glucose dehydrogenase
MPGFGSLSPQALRAVVQYVLTGEAREVAAAPSPIDMKYRFTGYHKWLDPDGYPAVAPPWGTLNAINLNTGEYAWKIPLGEYPELAAKGVKDTGSENYGGPIVTAGGLIFIGATNFDKKFRAFDKDTGKLLWETTMVNSGNGTRHLRSKWQAVCGYRRYRKLLRHRSTLRRGERVCRLCLPSGRAQAGR